jgi:hypothetical protein
LLLNLSLVVDFSIEKSSEINSSTSSENLIHVSDSLSKPLIQKKANLKVDSDGFPIRKIHIKVKKKSGLKFREDS